MRSRYSGQTGADPWSYAISALQWALDNGIDVTNNGFGSSTNPGSLVQAAYANANAAGVLNVAAAGNTGSFSGTGNTMGWPASFSSVLAVTATNSSDVRPCFSSHGPESELAAPGVPIYSTYLGGYGTLSGTSMASSHVAGAAALVIAAGAQDPDNVRQILTDTVLDLGATGPDDLYGFGLVDAAAAVTGNITVTPMNKIKAVYKRTPLKCNDCLNTNKCRCDYLSGLSWIEDSNEQREDIMASQAWRNNVNKWEARWQT